MKSTNDNESNNSNWLGFSLSPHMKMEVASDPQHHHHHYHHQSHSPAAVSDAVTTSFYLSSPQLSNPGICYGVGENGGFHSSLSVMPLKSDGSLCIMEALTRSQNEDIESPKLEDFLGSHEREAMGLSLDSMYYHQNPEPETNRQHSMGFLQDPFRQQSQFSIQQHAYYAAMQCPAMYQAPLEQEPKVTQLTECESQIPQMGDEGVPCFRNWVTRQYQTHNALEPQLNGSIVDDGGASGSVGAIGCGDLQSLTLSMSPGSQSSCVTAPRQISPTDGECVVIETKKRASGKAGQKQPVHRKSIDTFGQRTSQYRGVTRHRWTGRYEAHLWDNSCKKEGQTRKGRQVYLGGYDIEEKAARAYDLAALKYWGPSTHINFPLENYRVELEEMKNITRQEYVVHLRRKSSGFSRGASMYRGVTRHHQHGRWQARIGRVAGNKDLYLGTFSTQEEAAEAYDVAAIKFRGVNAVTNFDSTRYDVERIIASNTLLAGEHARRNKENETSNEAIDYTSSVAQNNTESIQVNNNGVTGSDWKMGLYHSPQQETDGDMRSLELNSIDNGNSRHSSFSMTLLDPTGMDSANPTQHPIVDESTKIGTQFSNASSLVTSLGSSREASPDKTCPNTLHFPKPPLASKFISNQAAGVNPWFSSPTQLRHAAAVSMAHLPVFAAWNDT